MGSQQFGALMRRSSIAIPTLQSPRSEAPQTVDENTEGADFNLVQLSSLGRIREGADGEMYIVEDGETAKDK